MELPVVIKIGYSVNISATLFSKSYSNIVVYFFYGLPAIGPTILLGS